MLFSRPLRIAVRIMIPDNGSNNPCELFMKRNCANNYRRELARVITVVGSDGVFMLMDAIV